MKLYTYIVKYDRGLAPNPWGNYCTLNVCKPGIRRTAQVGDWIVGTGSKHVKGHGDLSHQCVYLMEVTEKIPMSKYDDWALEKSPIKRVDFQSSDYKKKLGDSIYEFKNIHQIKQRPGIHNKENIKNDLSGEYTLISNNFIYFGDQAIDIPFYLLDMIKQKSGHRSDANQSYLNKFLKWKDELFNEFGKNQLIGKPQLPLSKEDCYSQCIPKKKPKLQCYKKPSKRFC
jgi:hypothetical protein